MSFSNIKTGVVWKNVVGAAYCPGQSSFLAIVWLYLYPDLDPEWLESPSSMILSKSRTCFQRLGGYCWRGPQALPLPLLRDAFCTVEYCLCYAPIRRSHDTVTAESTWLPLWPLPESGTSLDTTASEYLVASAYS